MLGVVLIIVAPGWNCNVRHVGNVTIVLIRYVPLGRLRSPLASFVFIVAPASVAPLISIPLVDCEPCVVHVPFDAAVAHSPGSGFVCPSFVSPASVVTSLWRVPGVGVAVGAAQLFAPCIAILSAAPTCALANVALCPPVGPPVELNEPSIYAIALPPPSRPCA